MQSPCYYEQNGSSWTLCCTSRVCEVSYRWSSVTTECVDLLEACPFSSRPSCLLNVVVPEEIHQVQVDGHLRPLGAWHDKGEWITWRLYQQGRGETSAIGSRRWTMDNTLRELLGGYRRKVIMSCWISGRQIQQLSGRRDARRLTSGDYGFGSKRYWSHCFWGGGGEW